MFAIQGQIKASLVTLVLCSMLFAALPAKAELPPDYQSWPAAQKQEYLWSQKIVPSAWQSLPEAKGLGWGGILKSLKSLGSLGKSFDHASDEMPAARQKLLHPYGSVAKVALISYPTNIFTGLLQGGVGLVRLSLAGDERGMGFTPGMAIKLFVDGKPSANLHVMNDLAGQGTNRNFFAKTFTNILPAPKSAALKAAVWYFSFFVPKPTELNIEHFVTVDARGIRPEKATTPLQIFFVPTRDVQLDEASTADYRTELTKIPVGTPLYDVWGTEPSNKTVVYIGRLVTESSFVASHYGDHQLFFQHNR